MRNIKGYNPKTVNHHLSSLRSYNDWLIESGRQTETVVLKNDFMKIQLQYASPSTVTKKDVEAFRQRLLESGSKRDWVLIYGLAKPIRLIRAAYYYIWPPYG